ncbi:MAG: InlB B-repeat-containing protein [Clostridia bacterium]|nr:InlB B-repeat-containing protein [Clostridia bacterium]
MHSKLKFLGMLIIVISMVCFVPTVFGAKEIFINKTIDKIVINFDYEAYPANTTRTYGELANDLRYTYPRDASYSTDTYCFVDSNHIGLSYKKNGEIIAVPYPEYDSKINANDELYVSYWIYPATSKGYEFGSSEAKVIFNDKELPKTEYVYKDRSSFILLYIHIPIIEGTKVDRVLFEEFEPIYDGQQYISNVEIDNSFDVPCTITKQGFLMFNKELTGTAKKGETVGQYVIVKLDEGYYWADDSIGRIVGTRNTFSQGEKISDNEYKFIYVYTIESKKDLLVIHDLPDIIEYKEGEEVKLSIYATSGATKVQWNEVIDLGGKKGTKEIPIEGATTNTLDLGKIDNTYDGKHYNIVASDDTGAIRKSKTFTLKCTGVVETTQIEQPAKTETPTHQPIQTEQQKTEVKYKVEFNSNGGNIVATQEVAEKGKVTKPATPTKDGYTFDGWYTDEKLTKVFDFNTAINSDITLYAKWNVTKKEEQPTISIEPTTNPSQPNEGKKETWSNASEWAKEELYKVNEENLMPWIFDKEDLTVNITRREFAYVAVKLYEKITNEKLVESKENPFIDTSDIEVLKAYNIGITNGTSATTFSPDTLITREQMATMMTRAVSKAEIDTKVDLSKVSKFADDSEMHDWGKESIYFMSNIEIIKGIGNNTFNVLGNATREQALLISVRSAAKFSSAK